MAQAVPHDVMQQEGQWPVPIAGYLRGGKRTGHSSGSHPAARLPERCRRKTVQFSTALRVRCSSRRGSGVPALKPDHGAAMRRDFDKPFQPCRHFAIFVA